MRGDRLKWLREGANLSQLDLAVRLSISETQIWRYENSDTEPRADVVVRLAEFFNVSTDYLLGRSDEQGIHVANLSPEESAVIASLRRGERMEAIKIIANDEKAHNGA